MTDEVAALVLRDNYEQTQALRIAERAGGRACSTCTRADPRSSSSAGA